MGALLSSNSTSPKTHFSFPVSVCLVNGTFPAYDLVDSEAKDNFLDQKLVKQLGVPLVRIEHPMMIKDLAGKDHLFVYIKLHLVVFKCNCLLF